MLLVDVRRGVDQSNAAGEGRVAARPGFSLRHEVSQFDAVAEWQLLETKGQRGYAAGGENLLGAVLRIVRSARAVADAHRR